MNVKRVTIFGSTGSIGKNAIDVIRRNKEYFKIVGLTCRSSYELLCKQVEEIQPDYVMVKDPYGEEEVVKRCKNVKISRSYEEIVKASDIVLMAESTPEGIYGVIEALKREIRIALATKEILVVYGEYLRDQYDQEMDKFIIPVDSEHSAIFQCLQDKKRKVKRIILTASGGPFFHKEDFENITIEDALNHPIWKMGKKITVDSATMMNKALEIIEAYYLFKIENIDVMVHPEGIIHSMVEFKDGSTLAQLSNPDMRLPIEYALFFPETGERIVEPLDFSNKKLTFFNVNEEKFRAMKIAKFVLNNRGSYSAVMSGSDRGAVELFLEKKIKFKNIIEVIEKVIEKHKKIKKPSLEDLNNTELWAYRETRKEK